jgi:uncharacterized protein YbjQ (UPF0145 family)
MGRIVIQSATATGFVGMRRDRDAIGEIMSEVAAYGTAVTVEPIQPASTVTPPGAG